MARRPAKKPTTFCKLSHIRETEGERRARIDQRKARRDRRAAENASGHLVNWRFPGMGGKYVPAGPGKNVTEKRETARRAKRAA